MADPALAETDELVRALRNRAQSNAAEGRRGFASGRKRTASRYGRRAAFDEEVADRLEEQAEALKLARAALLDEVIQAVEGMQRWAMYQEYGRTVLLPSPNGKWLPVDDLKALLRAMKEK